MHSPALTGSPRTPVPQFRPSSSSWTHPSGSPSRIVVACLLASALGLSLHAQQWIEVNHALAGSASQSSTIFDGNNPDAGNAALAIDGNVNGVFNAASGSVTHSGGAAADADAGGPFWEVDLAATKAIGRLHLFFRTDCCQNRNDDFTLVILDASRNEVFRRSYAGRPPADVAYNIAPAVNGRFVRFEPQNPLSTSDGIFSIAELQVVAPYQGVTLAVAQQPADVTVTEGRRATFGPVSAGAAGLPADRVSLQWQRNGVDIPGATAATYTTPSIQGLANNNDEYSVRFLTSGQAVSSAKARLTVAKDVVPPTAESLAFSGGATLLATVRFNEVMDATSAQNPANYQFGAGVTVARAVMGPIQFDPADQHPYQVVVLSLSGLAQNSPYTAAVTGVKDLAGNVMTPATFAGNTPFFELNWAMGGNATQSSTAPGGEAFRATDGITDGFFSNGSVTLNAAPEDPGWWEVDLLANRPIGRVKVWFRTLTADECQALFNSCLVRNDDFILSILDSNRNVVWSRAYPGRPTLQVAYNLPPGVQGRFVRFESQTPLSTSDGYFSLAEVQVIAPYQNVALNVSKDLPAAVAAVENQRALLGPVVANVAGADGAAADTVQYQWTRNGVDIAGANNSTYQTPALTLADDQSKYRCKILISGAIASSTEATLSVSRDATPPAIKGVTPGQSYTDVTLLFTEAVTEATAGNRANYALSGNLVISDLTVLTPTSVRLTTSLQTPGTQYTVTLNGIRDLASGGGNLIAANTKATFTAPRSDADRYIAIGNPGNPKDTQWNTARGKVDYVYDISKFKVSNAEYAAFLNAVARKSDPRNLMVSGGGEILREGDEGNYTYRVLEGRENRPVLFVAAVDAMRMANWLSNGAREDSDTETGTYTFTAYDVLSKRNANADYFLPTDDEWYKAAYYDPTKNGTGGYWQYSPKTDDPNLMIAELPPGGPFSANFNSIPGTDGNGTTDVGAYTGAASFYGTFDQSGLSWEWNEPMDLTTKRTSRRGGSQGNNVARIAAGAIADNAITKGGASANQSFRLARAHTLRIKLTPVGNPGNAKDAQWNTARGKVDYDFQIGKFKVSNAEYAAFLNAVARKADPYNLMPSGGGEILREGDEGNYTYRVLEGRENRPVLFVAAVDAMRMANWLSNGAREDSDTETGTYTFTAYDVLSKRNANADYFLPTDDEWYKAAYYDPTKNGTGGFWQYSPRTDDPNKMLAELPPGGPFSANFNSIPGTDGNGTTDVGAYTAAASFYGTFDQSGLSWEWNEPLDPTTKRASRRGGSQGNNVARIAAGAIADNAITKGGASANQSFRLALVTPSPAPVPAVLTVTRVSATQVRVTWTGSGVLQSTTAIGAPWTNVPGNPANTHDVTVGEGSVLFRVVSP